MLESRMLHCYRQLRVLCGSMGWPIEHRRNFEGDILIGDTWRWRCNRGHLPCVNNISLVVTELFLDRIKLFISVVLSLIERNFIETRKNCAKF